MQIEKLRFHHLQKKAIHSARLELEKRGAMEAGKSLEACRQLAGRINLGNNSISALSLKQPAALIRLLIEKGARIDNRRVCEFDIKAESAPSRQDRLAFGVEKTSLPADPQPAPSADSSEMIPTTEMISDEQIEPRQIP